MIRQLKTLYSAIHSDNFHKIISGREIIDPLLSAPETDKRFGITMLIPIKNEAAKKIYSIENEIRIIEPDQYFYPVSDLHITILDLIGAHENFRRDNELIGKFIRLIKKAISGVAPFDISFKGIIVSSMGILAKGYYQEGLQEIRTRMRAVAGTEGIHFQERYQSISAHITFVRFKSPLRNRSGLSSYIQKESDRDLGTMTVKEIHLVIHDWYNMRKEEITRFTITG